jgi:hypothetical protein
MRAINPNERIFYVYQLRVDGQENPFYIGKGSGNRRFAHFQSWMLAKRSLKSHIILKAQRANLMVHSEIVQDELTDWESCALEAEWIEYYGRRNVGTGCLANLTDGGDGGQRGYVFTELQRKKVSDAVRGRKLSEEHKQKLRVPHSEEWNAKMRKGVTGKKRSEETKRLIASVVLTPIEEFKDRLRRNNCLITLLEYNIVSRKSKFHCLYCNTEFISWSRNISMGVLPPEHKDCRYLI